MSWEQLSKGQRSKSQATDQLAGGKPARSNRERWSEGEKGNGDSNCGNNRPQPGAASATEAGHKGPGPVTRSERRTGKQSNFGGPAARSLSAGVRGCPGCRAITRRLNGPPATRQRLLFHHRNTFLSDGRKGRDSGEASAADKESRGPALWRGPGPARGPVLADGQHGRASWPGQRQTARAVWSGQERRRVLWGVLASA